MNKQNLFKKLTIKYVYFLAALFFVATTPFSAYAEWQSVLENNFDIVSTFDDLEDWIGSRPSNSVDIETYPNEFPQKINGGNSIWKYYYASEAPNPNYKWIANHGSDNVWRGTGKSAVIDYNDGVDGIKRGPQRLAFKIGDNPSDGYDEVYLFFMTKWFKDFFKFEEDKPDSFAWQDFLKTLDVSSGFKTVRHFGTDEEYNWLSANGANTQGLNEYGLNAQVYNFLSLRTSPNRTNIVLATILTTDKERKTHYEDNVFQLRDTDVGTSILNNEWFGIEYRIKSSDPHGTANGEIEVWIYDKNGNVTSHELLTEVVTLEDGNTPFNHKWNKFVWGGNRYAGSYCGSGDPLCQFGTIDHFYFDDVIAHGNRIGVKYFELVSDNNVQVDQIPGPPKNSKLID